MSAMASASFAASRHDSRALNRAVTWSLVIHLSVVAAIFLVPREWLSAPRTKPRLMTITLGGTEGPKTTGMAAMSSRTVEKVAPPEKRPEPPRPVSKAEPAAAAVIRTPPKADPSPQVATIKPSSAATRPPVTGARIVSGTAAVETGSRSQSVGLATGGGAGGGEADIMNFCCPEYITQMLNTIDSNWKKDPVEHGSSTLKFTIYRDGSIHDIVVEKPSGSGILDRNAKSALLESRLLKLPAEYTRPTLTIHLTFPNGA